MLFYPSNERIHLRALKLIILLILPREVNDYYSVELQSFSKTKGNIFFLECKQLKKA